MYGTMGTHDTSFVLPGFTSKSIFARHRLRFPGRPEPRNHNQVCQTNVLFEVTKMEEQQIECPGCGVMMPVHVLNEINHCDNCQPGTSKINFFYASVRGVGLVYASFTHFVHIVGYMLLASWMSACARLSLQHRIRHCEYHRKE